MKHLTDEQFAAWTSGERNDEAAALHLGECAACAEEARGLTAAVAAFSSEIQDRAAARVPFTGGHIRARAEMQARPTRAWWRLLPVPALAAAIVIAMVMMRAPEPKPPAVSQDAADEALLMQINRDVYRAAPAALTPVAAINKERNQLLTKSQKQNQ